MTKIPLTKRQEKAIDISRNRCVTASAGTGKTFVLTKRYVNLLKSGIDLSEILCLTFTDKASAEMREKIEREIRSTVIEYDDAVAAGEKPELTVDEYRKLTAALAEIHRCTISTFHSFCSSILKEYPIESGVPIGYSIMTGIDVQDLVKNTINETLEHPDEKIRPYVITLHRFVSRPSDITNNISTLLAKRKVCPEWFDLLKKNPEKIVDGWKKLQDTAPLKLVSAFLNDADIEKYFAFIAENNISPSYNTRYHLYTELKKAKATEEIKTAANTLFTKTAKSSNIKPPEVLTTKYNKYANEYKKNLPKIAECRFSMEDAHTQFMLSIMRAYIEVTDDIAAKIAAKKSSGSYLNFDELIAFTQTLLHDADFSRALSDRYKHVLVDEVQDNDPALTEIVNNLTEDLNRKKLFIVGDMKQSIYRFKGSDPESVKRDLFGRFDKIDEIELDTNFRTVKPLIAIINTIFKRLYPENNSDDITYADVIASREDRAGTLTKLVRVGKGNENPAVDEAEMLASWITSKVGQDPDFVIYGETKNSTTGEKIGWRNLNYSDITILVRKNNDAEPIKKVFSRYGIRCHVYKGKNFYQEQEIFDLVSVIKASVFYEDDTALYGALKSPYFSISDAELALASYSRNTHAKTLHTRLKEFAEKTLEDEDTSGLLQSAKEKIGYALQLLQEFSTSARTKPLLEFLNEILRKTGILTVYAAHPCGQDKIRDLKKFLSTAAGGSASRSMSVYDFIRMIETCIEENIDDESGSTAGEEDSEDAVQIMSYHVSKGLEFPVVVLFKTGQAQDDHLKGVLIDKEYGAGLASLKYPGEKTNLFEFLKLLIKYKVHPKNVAEEKRLLYVGMTRARDHLVLTASENDTGKVGENSYIEMYTYASADVPEQTIYAGELDSPSEIETVLKAPEKWGVPQEEKNTDATVRSNSAEKENENTPSESKAWAMSRGLCLHAIFEGLDPAEMCRKYGFENEMEKFVAARKEFYDSALMERKLRIWPELQLFGRKNAGTNTPENKRADLLVQYEDRSFRLFDFKSGSLDSNKKYLADYFKQLKEYSAILETIFHTKIQAYLYFPEEDKDRRVMKVETD